MQGIANAIGKYLEAVYKEKDKEVFQAIMQKVFDQLYDAMKKVQCYIEEIHDNLDICVSDATKSLLGFANVLSQSVISLSCSFPTKPTFWLQLKSLYKECGYSKMMMSLWQTGLERMTKSLVTSLTEISSADFDAMRELCPFKGRPMVKKYVLQVLLDAYRSGGEKYARVRSMGLYVETFEVWMRLLEVVDIGEEALSKVALQEYSKGIASQTVALYSVVNNLMNFEKTRNTMEYSSPLVHSPPSATFFVPTPHS